MIVTVFANEKDATVEFLGKALIKLLDRKYFVFTREPSAYPQCPVEKTMEKLREIAKHIEEERLIVCFGCRVFPNSIKEIESVANKKAGNVVLLKKLRGSKTWHDVDGKLSFENERIADCGIFILNKSDLLQSDHVNFNAYIRSLLTQDNLKAAYIDYWLFSNNPNNSRRPK